MPSSSSRGGTSRPRRASSPSAPARPGASARPDAGRRTGATRRSEPSRASDAGGPVDPQAGSGALPLRRLAVLGLIVVVLAIMLVPTVRRYLDQRAQIAALREHIATKQQTVDELARERAIWNDPAYIEAQARERLHFVKPGETGYTLTTRQDDEVAARDAQVVGVDAAAASLPWYGKVWGSLEAADRLGGQVTRTPAGTTTPAPSDPASPQPTITDTASPSVDPTSTTARR